MSKFQWVNYLSDQSRTNRQDGCSSKSTDLYRKALSAEEQTRLTELEKYLFTGTAPTERQGSRERLHSEAAFVAFYLFVFFVCLLPTYGVFAGWREFTQKQFTKLVRRQPYSANPEQAKPTEKHASNRKNLSWQWGWMIFGELVYRHDQNLYLRRQVYLAGCLLAMLCLSLPMGLISYLPARYPEYWQSFTPTDRRLILGGLFCVRIIIAVHLTALFLTAGRILSKLRGAFGRKKPGLQQYSKLDFGTLVLFVIVLPLIALTLLVGYHFLPFYLEPANVAQILLWERTVGNFSGVSPLLPLSFIATATLTWALCSLRRLRLLERKPLPQKKSEAPAPESEITAYNELEFLEPKVAEHGATPNPTPFESEGISRLEQRVHQMLSCSLNRLPGFYWTFPPVVVACLLIMGARLMPSVEGRWFNSGITALFILAYLAIALNFLRFLCVWVALRRLLRRLSWHPLLMGYRDPEKDKEKDKAPALGRLRLDLSSPLPTFTTLSKSVEQARLFWRVLQAANFNTDLKQMYDLATSAEKDLKKALNHDANNAWAEAFSERNQVRSKLIKLSNRVAVILAPQWTAESQGADDFCAKQPQPTALALASQTRPGAAPTGMLELQIETQPDSIKQPVLPIDPIILAQGERFLVSRLIGFLQYVLAQMQNLVAFVTVGILLMLGAVLSYPFQPMSPLLIFNWVTIIGVVSITMLIFVQMNRNPTLSLLSGTNPGELDWNSQFILQVLVHGLLPLLAITGAQFSDSFRELLTSLGITSSGASH